jgi:hypothetical protein
MSDHEANAPQAANQTGRSESYSHSVSNRSGDHHGRRSICNHTRAGDVHYRVRHRAYDLPHVLRSYEDLLRFDNLDVAGMSASERESELCALRLAVGDLAHQGDRFIVSSDGELVSALGWLQRRCRLLEAEDGS